MKKEHIKFIKDLLDLLEVEQGNETAEFRFSSSMNESDYLKIGIRFKHDERLYADEITICIEDEGETIDFDAFIERVKASIATGKAAMMD